MSTEDRGHKSLIFTNYLISTCWPKMVRRIASWQAMGFIFLLAGNISIEQLHAFGSIWDGFPSTLGPGDKTLLDVLSSFSDKLKRRLLLASDRDVNYNSLKYTENDFPVMFGSGAPRLLFTQENIREFHKLTVAAFEGFAFTFLQLKKESRKLVGGIA